MSHKILTVFDSVSCRQFSKFFNEVFTVEDNELDFYGVNDSSTGGTGGTGQKLFTKQALVLG